MKIGNKVTVIMYHFVRNLQNSKYPNIKGLDFKLFTEQILFLSKWYNFISIEELINAYKFGEKLPEKAVLLTFDDGYSDHFDNVFPFLKKKGIKGAFYIPVKTCIEHTVLDVNKIHFILALTDDNRSLLLEIKLLLEKYSKSYRIESFEYYYKKLAVASRFDTAEVIFIKRLLQVELPIELRNLIVNELFVKSVNISEDEFSKEVYMNKSQIKEMITAGMHIGSHGFDHFWLGRLDKESQRDEIVESINFIKSVGGNIANWTISYPYGNYNIDTLDLLVEYNCNLGFTTEIDVAKITEVSQFKIPRLDTNDIPKFANSHTNEWYKKG